MVNFREIKDMMKLLESYEPEKVQKLIKEVEKISRGLISFLELYALVNRVLEIM
jgi:hypothetical protein